MVLGVLGILIVISLSFVCLTALAVGLAVLGQRLLANAGGLTRLAARFPATAQPAGQTFRLRSVQIGAVKWTLSTTVSIAEEGLYLSMRTVLVRHPSILIPWDEIKRVRRTTLYLQEARRLYVGEPSVGHVVVKTNLFRAIEPHLKLESPPSRPDVERGKATERGESTESEALPAR